MSKKQILNPTFYPTLARFLQEDPWKMCALCRYARHRDILLLTWTLTPVTNVGLQ